MPIKLVNLKFIQTKHYVSANIKQWGKQTKRSTQNNL